MFGKKLAVFCIFLLAAQVYAQKANTEKWESYKIKKEKISFSLPHLPVLTDYSDLCRETIKKSYYAYQQESVYSLTIFSRAKDNYTFLCPNAEKFSEKTFNVRSAELTKTFTLDSSFSKTFQGRRVIHFSGKNQDIWVFNDLINKRWVELSVINDENKTIDFTYFIDSLKFDDSETGIEIGAGSPIMLGDEENQGVIKITDQNKADEKSEENKVLLIIAKPAVKYTDAARSNQIQGTVTLLVTFQSNGAIGKIITVKGLGGGLTEEAIKSARKIVFLPQRKNGVPETIEKEMQYSFSTR